MTTRSTETKLLFARPCARVLYSQRGGKADRWLPDIAMRNSVLGPGPTIPTSHMYLWPISHTANRVNIRFQSRVLLKQTAVHAAGTLPKERTGTFACITSSVGLNYFKARPYGEVEIHN